MARISRDKMFIRIAQTVALRGTCDRAQVGAILVENGKNIVSIGYNGSPSGHPHCDDVGHLMENGHCIRTTHAEVNCIKKWYRRGNEDGLTMYVTHYPCMLCVLDIVRAVTEHPHVPLRRIVYLNPYRVEDEPSVRENLLKGAGITIEQFVGEPLGGDQTT